MIEIRKEQGGGLEGFGRRYSTRGAETLSLAAGDNLLQWRDEHLEEYTRPAYARHIGGSLRGGRKDIKENKYEVFFRAASRRPIAGFDDSPAYR